MKRKSKFSIHLSNASDDDCGCNAPLDRLCPCSLFSSPSSRLPLLTLLPALLLSQSVAIYDLQAEASTSVSLSPPLTHTHTHAYSFANILLEQKSISSLQRLLSLSLTLARCFSFSWSFTVWRFLLGLWAHCDLQVEPARTTRFRLCRSTGLFAKNHC